MQQFTINIPGKPHIVKFAHKRYGMPIALNNNSALSALITGLLHKPNFSAKYKVDQKDIRFRYFTAHLQCAAPLSQMGQLGHALTTNHIIQINTFLENDFKERLVLYVAKTADFSQRRSGIDQAIDAFASFYGIDIPDDISFDGLRKMEWRARSESTERHFPTLNLAKAHPLILL